MILKLMKGTVPTCCYYLKSTATCEIVKCFNEVLLRMMDNTKPRRRMPKRTPKIGRHRSGTKQKMPQRTTCPQAAPDHEVPPSAARRTRVASRKITAQEYKAKAVQEMRRTKQSERLLQSAQRRVDRLHDAHSTAKGKVTAACDQLRKTRAATRKMLAQLTKVEAEKDGAHKELAVAKQAASESKVDMESQLKVSYNVHPMNIL